MKKHTLFTSEFQQEIKAELSHLETQRKETQRTIIWMFVPFFLKVLLISGGLGFVIVWAAKNEYSYSGDFETILVAFAVMLFMVLFIVVLFYNKKKQIYQYALYQGNYYSAYKKKVIEKTISYTYNNMSYNSETGIAEESFRESGFPLFANPVTYYSSHSVFGEIGKTNFQFAEVLAEQFIDDGESQQTSDLFRGVFFVADLHKKINCNTIVYPDVMKYFSKLLVGSFSEEKAFREQNYQRIKLEDTEFEKYFQVYGTDQVESRYVLSPALMLRMVHFKRKTKKDILFSFKDSKIYFGIYYSGTKNLFKPPLFKSTDHLEPLENYISDLELMLDVLTDLNLNSKLNQ